MSGVHTCFFLAGTGALPPRFGACRFVVRTLSTLHESGISRKLQEHHVLPTIHETRLKHQQKPNPVNPRVFLHIEEVQTEEIQKTEAADQRRDRTYHFAGGELGVPNGRRRRRGGRGRRRLALGGGEVVL